MKRILICLSLGICSLLVIWMFVTAKTYAQLGVAVVLYPILAYLIIKAFPRKILKTAPGVNQSESIVQTAASREILDMDKRTFLKLVGATGIFFFVSSLLGKWLGTIPFSQGVSPLSTKSNNADAGGDSGGSFTTNGYTITEIDEGIVSYYGFTNKDGAWLIMKEDSDISSFRYAKGDINFPNNWGNRAQLKYDYYYNLE
jgi:hypothetical protein